MQLRLSWLITSRESTQRQHPCAHPKQWTWSPRLGKRKTAGLELDLGPSISAEISYYTHGTVITQNCWWKYLLQTITSKIAIRHPHQRLSLWAAFLQHATVSKTSLQTHACQCRRSVPSMAATPWSLFQVRSVIERPFQVQSAGTKYDTQIGLECVGSHTLFECVGNAARWY